MSVIVEKKFYKQKKTYKREKGHVHHKIYDQNELSLYKCDKEKKGDAKQNDLKYGLSVGHTFELL